MMPIMPHNRRRLGVALLAIAGTAFLRASVSPSPLFTDHAVLQRDADVPVWGTADPGERVTVSFAGQRVATTADRAGQWTVKLAALPAGVRGALMITGENNSVSFQDVIAGDVWLCSGQSNMGLNVGSAANAAAEIAAASEPDIRQYRVPAHPSPEPQADTFLQASWQPASPQTVGSFTAAGYFFAREIKRQLGVPIGLINSSWGGTSIQPWMPFAALQAYPGYQKLMERKQAELAAWPGCRKMPNYLHT